MEIGQLERQAFANVHLVRLRHILKLLLAGAVSKAVALHMNADDLIKWWENR